MECLRFLDLPVFLFKFSMLHLNVKTEFSFEEQEDLVHWQVRHENLYAVMETEVFPKRKTCCWSTMRRRTAATSTTVSGTAAPPTLFERWEEPFSKPRYIIFVSASLSDSPPSSPKHPHNPQTHPRDHTRNPPDPRNRPHRSRRICRCG